MKLAKVIGTVVCTVKDPSLDGQKILLIQPLDDDQKPAGRPIASGSAGGLSAMLIKMSPACSSQATGVSPGR